MKFERNQRKNFDQSPHDVRWCAILRQMQLRNIWMVDRSQYIIGVWDGTEGGTANCIEYAKKKDINILIIKP